MNPIKLKRIFSELGYNIRVYADTKANECHTFYFDGEFATNFNYATRDQIRRELFARFGLMTKFFGKNWGDYKFSLYPGMCFIAFNDAVIGESHA